MYATYIYIYKIHSYIIIPREYNRGVRCASIHFQLYKNSCKDSFQLRHRYLDICFKYLLTSRMLLNIHAMCIYTSYTSSQIFIYGTFGFKRRVKWPVTNLVTAFCRKSIRLYYCRVIHVRGRFYTSIHKWWNVYSLTQTYSDRWKEGIKDLEENLRIRDELISNTIIKKNNSRVSQNLWRRGVARWSL